MCWAPELRLFCAVSLYGTAAQQIMTSSDGITPSFYQEAAAILPRRRALPPLQ